MEQVLDLKRQARFDTIKFEQETVLIRVQCHCEQNFDSNALSKPIFNPHEMF